MVELASTLEFRKGHLEFVIEENGTHIKGSRFFDNKAITAVAMLFVLGGSIAASAQWTASNTSHAWSGYNNNFRFTNSSGQDQFRAKESGTTATGFWMYADQIELAVDAYYWAQDE